MRARERTARAWQAALLTATAACWPALSAAEQKFSLAGIDVTMAEDGWEIADVPSPPAKIGYGGIEGNTPREAKLLLRRSGTGELQAALLVFANRAMNRQVIVRGGCWKAPPAEFFVRSYAPREADPPQCLLLGGPYHGQRAVDDVMPRLKAAQAVRPFEPPAAAYMVVSFVMNPLGASFGVEGLVSRDFNGLPGTPPAGPTPAQLPDPVLVWGETLGTAVSKALDGFFSNAVTLPPITFPADK